jgi:hypothetical protein
MAVTEALSALSTTAASNTPAGTDSIGTDLDDHLRDIKKNIRFASNNPVQAAKITAYTVLATDHNTLLQVNATASAVTVTLLAAATAGDGFKVGVKRLNTTNSVTVDGNASETIDVSVTSALTTINQVEWYVCDGSKWHIESDYIETDPINPNPTTIELGHATDTTLARSSAGVLAVEGVAVGLTGKHTAWVPVSAMRPTTSNGCSSVTDFETTAGRPDFQAMYFDGAADEHAQFSIAFPKGWNEGTVTFRAVWGVTDTAATDGSDTVSWGLQGLGVADDASVDQAYGTGVVVTEASSGTVEDIAISAESSAITIASAAVDTLTFFRVYRDVTADDMTEDAALIGIQIFYTIDAGNDS